MEQDSPQPKLRVSSQKQQVSLSPAKSPAYGLAAWFSPGKPVDCGLCLTATTPGDRNLREMLLENVHRTVHIGMDCRAARLAYIQSSMGSVRLAPRPALAASLRRV